MKIWRDVVGFEGIYEVSECGSVRSLDRIYKRNNDGAKVRKTGRVLKQALSEDGYPCLNLKNAEKGLKKSLKVHRIVAEAFVDNKDHYLEVNHIDEDKKNNNASNLEWCTRKHNMNHGTAMERMVKSPGFIKARQESMKPVVGVSLSDGKRIRFESLSKADENGFPRRNVQAAIIGSDKSCRGYVWFFEDEFNEAGIKIKIKEATKKLVVQKDLNGCVVGIFGGIKEAGAHVERDSSNISRACTTGRTCAGFKWEYDK